MGVGVAPNQFTGNETGPYENPRENAYYHHLNPAQQNIIWMHQWKKQHWDIHQACKELGQTTYSDEYVKGFMDGASLEPSNPVPLNISKMEEEVDSFVKDIMNSNQGMEN